MVEQNMREEDLSRLKDLNDFDIGEDEPDPRGWHILAADGRDIGDVDELIVDTGAMKVRYLDCDVDETELGLEEEDRHVLIPIGYAELDEDNKQVRVSRFDSDDVEDLPLFQGLPLTRDYENMVESRFARGESVEGQATTPDTGGMRVTRSEEELDVTAREREAGEIDIEKDVETEHVRRPVTRRHDEVDIERRPVAGRASAEDQFEEEEVRIPLSEEELDVSKHPEVKEELIVRKRSVEEPDEVEGDIRKERIDIHETDDIEREK